MVTSDRYAGYAFIDPERRQVCWAHLLRDFNRIAQRSGLAGRVGQRLLGLGWVMFRKHHRGQLANHGLQGLQRRVHEALQRGVQQGECTRTAKTCANILKLWPALWTFTTHDAVAPTNKRGRAGAAQPRAQAQDLRAHALAARRPVPGSRLQRS